MGKENVCKTLWIFYVSVIGDICSFCQILFLGFKITFQFQLFFQLKKCFELSLCPQFSSTVFKTSTLVNKNI